MYDGVDPFFKTRGGPLNTNFLHFIPYSNHSNSEVFFFSGNSYSLKSRVKELEENFFKYKSLRINITGTQVKNADPCCFWSTIVLGSIFIFPLFFICCDWWKKRTGMLFNIQN